VPPRDDAGEAPLQHVAVGAAHRALHAMLVPSTSPTAAMATSRSPTRTGFRKLTSAFASTTLGSLTASMAA
jgi:hypothetical protein